MLGSIRVACPWCCQPHEVRGGLVGRKFRCKKCSGVIKVYGPEGASDLVTEAPPKPVVRAASETETSRRPPLRPISATPTSQRVSVNPGPPGFDPFGLDPEEDESRLKRVLRKDFEADGRIEEEILPERVGFRPLEASADPEENEDESASPKRRRKKKRRKSGSGRSSAWEQLETGLLIAGFVGCLSLLGIGFFIPSGRAFVVLVSLIAGIVMSWAGYIWSVTVPFQESVRCGLMYLFVPFYSWYYAKTRWDEMFKPVMLGLFGTFLVYMTALGPLHDLGEAPSEGAAIEVSGLDTWEEDEGWTNDADPDVENPMVDDNGFPTMPGLEDGPSRP